jgi:hypothetical protein
MASLADLKRYLRALFLVFLGRAEGLRAFDFSFAGFWSSFGALVPMAPFLAIMVMSERLFVMRDMDYPDDFDTAGFFAWRITSILIEWVGLPLLLAVLARPLGYAARYVPLVVALNWSSFAIAIPLSLPHVLHAAGLIDGQATGLLHLALLIPALRLEYLVMRFAGGVTAPVAAGLVALDVAASILLDVGLSTLTGTG